MMETVLLVQDYYVHHHLNGTCMATNLPRGKTEKHAIAALWNILHLTVVRYRMMRGFRE